MKIAVVKEDAAGETRCSATPETVKKFTALGAEVAVESGAGSAASVTDEAFLYACEQVRFRRCAFKALMRDDGRKWERVYEG